MIRQRHVHTTALEDTAHLILTEALSRSAVDFIKNGDTALLQRLITSWKLSSCKECISRRYGIVQDK